MTEVAKMSFSHSWGSSNPECWVAVFPLRGTLSPRFSPKQQASLASQTQCYITVCGQLDSLSSCQSPIWTRDHILFSSSSGIREFVTSSLLHLNTFLCVLFWHVSVDISPWVLEAKLHNHTEARGKLWPFMFQYLCSWTADGNTIIQDTGMPSPLNFFLNHILICYCVSGIVEQGQVLRPIFAIFMFQFWPALRWRNAMYLVSLRLCLEQLHYWVR
jgi:hypothetical protein